MTYGTDGIRQEPFAQVLGVSSVLAGLAPGHPAPYRLIQFHVQVRVVYLQGAREIGHLVRSWVCAGILLWHAEATDAKTHAHCRYRASSKGISWVLRECSSALSTTTIHRYWATEPSVWLKSCSWAPNSPKATDPTHVEVHSHAKSYPKALEIIDWFALLTLVLQIWIQHIHRFEAYSTIGHRLLASFVWTFVNYGFLFLSIASGILSHIHGVWLTFWCDVHHFVYLLFQTEAFVAIVAFCLVLKRALFVDFVAHQILILLLGTKISRWLLILLSGCSERLFEHILGVFVEDVILSIWFFVQSL